MRSTQKFNECMAQINNSLNAMTAEFRHFEEMQHEQNESMNRMMLKLTDDVKAIQAQTNKNSEQYSNLKVGMMELLGTHIDEKYDRFVELGGIPADEFESFKKLFEAYKANGGNGEREAKYNAAMRMLHLLDE